MLWRGDSFPGAIVAGVFDRAHAEPAWCRRAFRKIPVCGARPRWRRWLISLGAAEAAGGAHAHPRARSAGQRPALQAMAFRPGGRCCATRRRCSSWAVAAGAVEPRTPAATCSTGAGGEGARPALRPFARPLVRDRSDGRFGRCNPAFERVLGTAAEPARCSLIDFVHPEDVSETLARCCAALPAANRCAFETRCRCADGSYKWLMWSINRYAKERPSTPWWRTTSPGARPPRTLRAESAFRKAMEGLGRHRPARDRPVWDASSTSIRLLPHDRLRRGRARRCPAVSVLAAGAARRVRAQPVDDAVGGVRSGFEMRIRRKNGERFDARFYLSPLIDLTGRQTGWMASITDITEPKRVRAALESAHERFEAVLDGLDAAVFVADARTDEILFANLAFKRIHGFRRGRAHGARSGGAAARARRLPRRSTQPVARRRATRALRWRIAAPAVGALVPRTRAGHALVDGRVVRMGIATDITDRKQTAAVAREQEERLQRTARLITMGEMASTLAHELNQPLAAIANHCAGSVTRLQSAARRTEDVLAAMQKASFQAERAGKIIRRVREFVKKSEPQRCAVDPRRGLRTRSRLRRHRRAPHPHPHPHRSSSPTCRRCTPTAS